MLHGVSDRGVRYLYLHHPRPRYKSVNRENNKVPFADVGTLNHRFRVHSVPLTEADWVSAGIQPTSTALPKVTQQRYGFLMQCPFVASELPALYSPHIGFLLGERL